MQFNVHGIPVLVFTIGIKFQEKWIQPEQHRAAVAVPDISRKRDRVQQVCGITAMWRFFPLIFFPAS